MEDWTLKLGDGGDWAQEQCELSGELMRGDDG